MRARLLAAIDTPAPSTGFLGAGHTAVEVLGARDLEASDPFVLLMDDRIAFAPGARIGEAHPHAGLETVTLVLEGSIYDRDEGVFQAGDVVWMTAGRGIVHGEHLESRGPTRILQAWVALPAHARGAAPRFQVIRGAEAPVRRAPGVEARVYGTIGEIASRKPGVVPVAIVELRLEPGAEVEQVLPGSHGAFVYVLEGAVQGGDSRLTAGQVAWLERTPAPEVSVRLRAGPGGARAVLYAGERLAEPIVQYGPFVAGSHVEITEMLRRYRAGRFVAMSELSAARAGG